MGIVTILQFLERIYSYSQKPTLRYKIENGRETMSTRLTLLPLILVGIFASLSGIAEASDTPAPAATSQRSPTPVAEIPSQWGKLGETKDEPARSEFLGGAKIISYSTKDHDSHHAHFVVWGKLVFVKPQTFNGKSYVTELVALHIDCDRSTFSLFRDIKLDEKGKVIDDSTKVSKFQGIEPKPVDLGLLPPPALIAKGAESETCGADTD